VGSHAAELQNYRAADMLGLHDFASPQIKKYRDKKALSSPYTKYRQLRQKGKGTGQ
jgi:hypothetical protein